MRRRRKLGPGVYYLIILGVIIVLAMLFALIFKGCAADPEPVAPVETPEPTLSVTPTPTPEPELGLYYAYRSGNLWGYKSNTGTVMIEAQYVDVMPFVDGYAFAAVTKDSSRLYGIIDTAGAWVVEPVYTNVKQFSEGLAAVQYNELWGYVNTSGAFIADPVYTDVGSFSGGMAYVCKDGKYGYINTNGQATISNQYDVACNFSEGLAFVGKTENGGTNYYLITDLDEVVAAVSIQSPGQFSQSLAAVQLSSGKYSYLNRRGKQSLGDTYDNALPFSEDLAAVCVDGKWGFIDTMGEFAIEPIYSDARSFHGGYAAVCDASGQWGYVDATGAVVIPCQYHSAGDFADGYAVVSKMLEQGLIDIYGNYKALYVQEPVATPSPEPEFEATMGTVNATSLNVRKEPSKDADKVTSLKDGTRVEVLDKDGDWYKIRYGEDVTGYVMTEYIKLED